MYRVFVSNNNLNEVPKQLIKFIHIFFNEVAPFMGPINNNPNLN